jgi:hypothetical protein
MNNISINYEHKVNLLLYICVYISWIIVIIGFTPLLLSNVVFSIFLYGGYFIIGMSAIIYLCISYLFIRFWKSIILINISIINIMIIIIMSIIMGVVLFVSPFLLNLPLGSLLSLYNKLFGILIIIFNIISMFVFVILSINSHNATRIK